MRYEILDAPDFGMLSFTLETGELATADRIDVGKPAPGKVVAPVSVWVTVKK